MATGRDRGGDASLRLVVVRHEEIDVDPVPLRARGIRSAGTITVVLDGDILQVLSIPRPRPYPRRARQKGMTSGITSASMAICTA